MSRFPTGETDFFYRALVPKDPWQNVAFRQWILEKCWADPKIAEEVWIICSRDLLFYVSVFGWLLEPRDKAPWQPSRCFGSAREIPFALRTYQEEVFKRMQVCLGKRDMLIEKSREMGATWMVLYLFDWAWRFHAHQHFGVMSKDEDSADKPDDPDSLLAKVDFIDSHLPHFLRAQRDRKADHTIHNRENASTIVAWACTGNVGRSGRKRAVFCDEAHFFPAISDSASLDSLQHTTYCRIIVSTPNKERGQSGAFYQIAQNQEANMERFELHWSLDDAKRAGLYHSEGNSIVFDDPTYVFPQGYKFVRDGKRRSPYFDYECSRPGATEASIASELEMDYGGSTSKFFAAAVIAKANALTREPNGGAEVRTINGALVPELIATDSDCPIDLWISPDTGISFADNGLLKIPEGRLYSMGVDVAYGTGKSYSSSSAFSVIDRRTSTQVAEYASNRISAEDFAIFCAQVGAVFNHAVMCVEATGIGQQFLAKIIQYGYRNLWFRPSSRDDPRQQTGHRAGYDNKDGGRELLGELQFAFQRDLFRPRSRRAVEECRRYYIDTNGNLKHPLVGKGRADAPEKSHGDCAIAMAAAWFCIRSEPEFQEEAAAKEEAPEGSFAWRRNLRNGKAALGPRYWSPLESLPQ
ncbi:MAG: hypothetical protein ACYCQK_01485 [Acidiferrobacteraceae bacterium]